MDTKNLGLAVAVVVVGSLAAMAVNKMFSIGSKIPKISG